MSLKDAIKTLLLKRSSKKREKMPLSGVNKEYSVDKAGALTVSEEPDDLPVKYIPDPVQDRPWIIRLENNISIVFQPVEAGEYKRGSHRWFSGERPQHKVVLTHSFWMSEYPVTQEQYEAVMKDNPSHFNGEAMPVEMVNWYEAGEFCRKLTFMDRESGTLPQGYVYRLPTEAEWEYAARGGSDSEGYKYAGSNDVDAVAWYGGGMGGNSNYSAKPVGLKLPNRLKLYDMSGNVWEWCHDWHENYPGSGTLINPTGYSEGSHRLLRGGSWGYEPGNCRVTRRDGLTPGHRYCDVGFRVVIGPEANLLKPLARYHRLHK